MIMIMNKIIIIMIIMMIDGKGGLAFGAQSWRPMAARNIVREVYSAPSSSEESDHDDHHDDGDDDYDHNHHCLIIAVIILLRAVLLR